MDHRSLGDALIVENVGEDAIVFDPATDEVHLVTAPLARALAAASDDVSRRNLLRAAALGVGAAAVTTLVAPTAASALCLPGQAGPLATPFDLETALATYFAGPPAAGDVGTVNKFGAFSAWEFANAGATIGTLPATITVPPTAAPYANSGGVQRFQAPSVASHRLTNPASVPTLGVGSTHPFLIGFTVPATGYGTGTGVRLATGSQIVNPGGNDQVAWAVYGPTGTKLTGTTNVNAGTTGTLTGGPFTVTPGQTVYLGICDTVGGGGSNASGLKVTLRWS